MGILISRGLGGRGEFRDDGVPFAFQRVGWSEIWSEKRRRGESKKERERERVKVYLKMLDY